MIWWAFGVSAVLFLVTLIVIPMMLIHVPQDYFLNKPVRDWPTRHPAIHITLVMVKNLLGALLVFIGIGMLVLPGQGLLTILIGITLLDFPGKRRVELWMINHRPLLNAVNWIRRRNNRPPLLMPMRHD